MTLYYNLATCLNRGIERRWESALILRPSSAWAKRASSVWAMKREGNGGEEIKDVCKLILSYTCIYIFIILNGWQCRLSAIPFRYYTETIRTDGTRNFFNGATGKYSTATAVWLKNQRDGNRNLYCYYYHRWRPAG